MKKQQWLGITVSAVALLSGSGLAQVVGDVPLMHSIEFRASTYSPSAQEAPALSVAPDGSFAVVWASRRQQQGRYGVYVQRFDARGVAVGSETPLNLWTGSHVMAPAIAHAADGSSWAAWQSAGQDGWGGAIIARRFDAQGAGGSEILVNQLTEGEQINPVLATLPDGGAVIAWSSNQPGEPERVVLRVYNADGSARTGELAVETDSTLRTTTPSIATRADGSFALAFGSFDAQDGKAAGVRVRVFSVEGEALGDASRMSGADALTPVEPSIEAVADGYVVAWHDVLENALGYDVLAARLDAAGAPVAEPVVVNTERVGLQNAAAVAVDAEGRITIAFNARDGYDTGVFARAFDTDLKPVGGQYRLTGRVHGTQAMREAAGTQRLAFAPDGTLLCAWKGDAGFGDSSSVNITMHSPTPFALGARTAGVTPSMLPARLLAAADQDLGAGVVVVSADAPEPHIPPTFDARDRDDAEREVLITGGDIGFTAVVNTGWTPPDPHLAVGPDHIVAMTNGEISFFTKDGTRTFQDEIEDSFGFWGSVGATGFVFDPEVIYDETSGRFFAMAAEAFAPGNRSYCLVAVSDDADPNGTWHKYRFDTTGTSGNLFDSPNIGVTNNALVITGDGFGLGAVYAVYIFDKAPLLVGSPPTITNVFELATSTQSAGFPRVTTGNQDTVYLVEHREGASNNSVRVLAFSDILTTPSVSSFDLPVPTYGPPEDPPQMGTSSRPNTFDARFWSVDQGPDGHIWATHHVNPNKVVARWYEIAPNGWPDSGNDPSLVQSGDIDLGPDVRTFFSSINASGDGSVAICYARSSPSEFLSMGSAYRVPCDPAGVFSQDFIHKSANAGYTAGRWGDYSAVQFDPSDRSVYWGHHEYADGGSWRTWIQSVETNDPCVRADINNDGSVNTQDVLLFLNAWTAQECVGDWNRDGSYNTLDVLGFLNDWTTCRS
ncbi:MAG: GC-type dockerin domain-anchored protein [Planctomycetota bacterium]|nr:GC-type dockerin domain-anchored protein [Planctomycetota bacterium]